MSISGTGWSRAITTAYAAVHYDGFYDLQFQGDLAGTDMPLMTTATSGVSVQTVEQGGDPDTLPGADITATTTGISHDNGVATTTGWTAMLQCYYSADPTSLLDMVVKGSTPGSWSPAVNTSVPRHLRAYYTVTDGNGTARFKPRDYFAREAYQVV